ncbi:hypothetical protein A3J91_04905 [Candidatus Peribacteria bacterium RIFOXYC2_FULL_58_10]|nr:MAG: hypothetical protein A3J91_04905 [Candidatus Peribacteria bacterium RIFOXYC2_FULL_58_10]OGJ84346.1 MAG: hypothetical protein A2529_05875 [Candidatus Peribacteria bacterium RIFOXYD2_FULL_58_15]
MKHYLFGRTQRLHIQFLRYLFVGGSASVVDFAVYGFCVARLDMHYAWAAIVGYTIGLIWNHLFSILWVFESKRWLRDFFLAAITAAGGLLWTELFLYLFIEWGDMHQLLAKFITLWIVLLWNFSVRKYLIFRN